MPETHKEKTIFSLLEVTNSIKRTIDNRYSSAYWIKAEMNKLNYYSHSGHCYPDLVEKASGKVIAQLKATLWRDDYQKINQNFISVLKEPLKEGIKILLLAKISFDPTFGLSLQILDIDPQYTLGDLENEKQETIKKLQSEGLFNSNKKLSLPLLPRRVAIISVETSKGLGDFMEIITTNVWNYKIFSLLFPSILQGEKAVTSIIAQLERIKKVTHHFDAVAIIRGGGGDVGLSCYNNYELAKAIAQFPIPVITGIGHVTNETVCEMIAHTNAITPTKLAELLLQKFHEVAVPLEKAKEKITEKAQQLLLEEKSKLAAEVKFFRSTTLHILDKKNHEIKKNCYALAQQSRFLLKTNQENWISLHTKTHIACKFKLNEAKNTIALLQEKIKQLPEFVLKNASFVLENTEKTIQIMDPVNVLKRGFSITYQNGKSIKDSSQLAEGSKIETQLYQGTVESTIIQIKS